MSNPSSYVYLDSARRVTGYEDRFAKPTTTCAYNDYKYGLDGIASAHYMDEAWNVIRERYANQWVTYLLGENDTDDTTADSTLDPDCAAMLQGDYRLQRGTIFYNYLNYFYGSRINCTQWIDTVPGVGHTSYGMFRSDCGVFSLFEDDVTACNSHLLPCVWVDFNYTGTAKGSYYRPYKTIGMAVDSVEVEGTVMMMAGSS